MPEEEACPPCEAPDADGDGYQAAPCAGDCDDENPSRHPGAPDPRGDGLDADCDGADGVDLDRDGFQAVAHGGDDCDDSRATVHPGANDNQGWVVEDTDFGGFNMLSLAVNTAGVAFLAGTDGDTCGNPDQVGCDTEGGRVLHYGTNLGGEWTDVTVDEGRIYPTVGIASIPSGEVLISYAFAADPDDHGQIRIARCHGLECQVETVALSETPARSQSGTDVAAGRCGDALVAYSSARLTGPLDASVPLSLVAVGQAAGWSEELVGERGSNSQDIEVGSLGTYLAFTSSPLGGETGRSAVALAHRAREGWSVALLTEYPSDWSYTDVALALGPDGSPSVAYLGGEGLFVMRTDATESGATKIADGWFSSRISLVADSTGSLHLSWAGQPDGRVHHATDRSGVWEVEDLAPALAFTSMAVDVAGTLHLAFAPRGYATYQPVNAIDENCDGIDGIDEDDDGRASRETGGNDADDHDATL